MSTFKVNAIIIGSVIVLLLLVNVIVGIKHVRNFSAPLKWLVGYLIFSFFCELLSSVYFVLGENNLWIINLYTIGEFILISIFFNHLTQKPDGRGNWFRGIMWLVVLGYIIYFAFVKSLFGYSAYTETLENLMLMGMCIYFFMYSLSNKPICKPLETPLVNWFAIGLFIYLSGIVLIWLGYEFLLSMDSYKDFRNLLLYFNGFLNFGFKLIVLIALLSFDHRIRRQKMLSELI